MSPTTRSLVRRPLTLSAAIGLGTLALATPTPASAASTTYHVATTGSDSNAGTSTRPVRTVQRAVDLATPGSVILVHAGNYVGQVNIRKSGTPSARLTIAPAGDGAVTLTSSPRSVSCDSRQPAPDRTIMITNGADYWTIRDLNIIHGIGIYGTGSNTAFSYFTNLVDTDNWSARRAMPGRGTNDPVAAPKIVDHLKSKTGKALDRAQGIEVTGNNISRRGIHAAFTANGVVAGNTIHDVDCGTGPGLWLITFSDKWAVTNNYVHHIARSTEIHYMQEGIRVGSASNYNTVSGNRVEDLPGDGRAYNTDVDSSFNVFERNIARRVAIGYNDQMSGWGNTWRYNRVEDYRDYGYSFRLMDASLTRPSNNTSTTGAVVKCNTALGSGKDLGVGGIQDAAFSGNSFDTAFVSANAQRYWGAEGNRYNGSYSAPTSSPSITTAGC